MTLQVARTRDEAHLYLDLHPCVCGSVETAWDSGVVHVAGELAACYDGICADCGMEREFMFALPQREVMPEGWPTFGGPEPSQLLDAGEWLWVSDLTAGNVPADDRNAARQALAMARATVDEVLKFIPDGHEHVPDHAFWSELGRQVRDAEPARFRRERLEVVRDTYRDLATDA
ncbi:hypothetical protein ETD86_47910 [Nonomuraea turkmeniaca]|uniref:Uncharacterized protein n=1 Tax=Nonomuraea turkmeniaca TaxID=103838 RepID=A0A5S4EXN9_9ACTN|nr:hypothetical protein [Nonomuraea turkmeniaca]TMR08414.1 hypothetical protein ETD86_47910 [Nonomuraea turkmeniaca]